MGHKTKLDIMSLVQQLQRKRNANVTITEMADTTGLTRTTIHKLLYGNPARIEMATIDKLLDYFTAQGLDVTIADLLQVTRDSIEQERQ